MINRITHHSVFFLVLSILVALPFIMHLPAVKTVDNVDYFTLQNDKDVLFYDNFKKVFGNDEFFIIAFKKDNIFTAENLNLLKDMTHDLEAIEEIREVKSLANVNDTIGEDDYFIVRPFLDIIAEEKPISEKNLTGEAEKEIYDTLRKNAISNPLYEKNFISSDGKTAAIVVSVYEKTDDPGYRKRLIKKCEKILEKYKGRTGDIYLAGWTTTNLYLSQYMKEDIATFIPITYIFITLSVFLFFRNKWLTAVAVLNISICMGSTMGLLAIMGITLNNVTAIVPPVVMALSLCDTVHIFSHLNTEYLSEFGSKQKALSNILQKVFWPSFLTTFTTFIGFLSLYLSDIPPIKDFAVIASCGMVFEFIFSFVFLPPVLLLFDERKIFQNKKDAAYINLLIEKIIKLVVSNFIMICCVGFLIIIVSIHFALKVKVETNLIEYFKTNSIVRQSINFVENNLSGIGTFDISFTAVNKDTFKDPEKLKFVEQIQTFINDIDGVDKTISFVDFIKDMNKSFNNERQQFFKLPDSRELISQYLLLYDTDDINDFVNESFDHTRISVRISVHSTMLQERIIREIKTFIDNKKFEGMEIRITGRALQDVNTIDSLVKGQIYSLATAAGIIIGTMFFMLRSFSMGCLSILPNLFPIAINFGIMGLFKIPLNTATALIAAVAIGIAVDDTIHFLSEFKLNLSKDKNVKESVVDALKLKGKAMLLSSLILCIGFGVMVFSQFVPTINFGVLSSIIMVTAIIGDILILPSAALLMSAIGVKFYTR